MTSITCSSIIITMVEWEWKLRYHWRSSKLKTIQNLVRNIHSSAVNFIWIVNCPIEMNKWIEQRQRNHNYIGFVQFCIKKRSKFNPIQFWSQRHSIYYVLVMKMCLEKRFGNKNMYVLVKAFVFTLLEAFYVFESHNERKYFLQFLTKHFENFMPHANVMVKKMKKMTERTKWTCSTVCSSSDMKHGSSNYLNE